MQRFNYQGRWYTLEQYQKLLNTKEETTTPKAVEVPNVSDQSKTEIPVEEKLETPKVEVKEELKPVLKPVKKSKKSNKK
jgi:hypothetical protein